MNHLNPPHHQQQAIRPNRIGQSSRFTPVVVHQQAAKLTVVDSSLRQQQAALSQTAQLKHNTLLEQQAAGKQLLPSQFKYFPKTGSGLSAGPFKAPAGLASTPGLAFNNNPNLHTHHIIPSEKTKFQLHNENHHHHHQHQNHSQQKGEE